MSPAGSRALRLSAAALFALCLIRVWHLLLLRQFLDEPSIVAAWLIAAFVMWLVVARPAGATIAFGALLVILLAAFHWGYDRAASDGREYFVQVRSIVMDRDLDFANENAVLGTRGNAGMYPIGLALLWSPFMVAAHVWLKILNLAGGTHTLDGFTNPYQRAIGLGTLLYGFAGLVLMWRVIRDYFGAGLAAAATAGVIAGSFILWYLVVESSMSHATSMATATLFLYTWHRHRRAAAVGEIETWRWVALGLSAGLMVLVRWQNVFVGVVPMIFALWDARRRGRPAASAAVFAACAFAVFLPQLIFWRIVRGAWLSPPAGDHGWDPGTLHIADVLFSPNHGLLASTPIVWFAAAGLLLLIRRDAVMALALAAGLVAQVFVNSASDGWWGGPGFGARRFDSCTLAFGLGLAGLLAWLRQRPLAVPLAVLGLLGAVNLTVMRDVHRRVLPSSEAVTFADMAESWRERFGNPFSFPYSWYVAWRYDASPAAYDRLKGRTYNTIDIDFGDPGDDTFLGHGWLSPERNESMSFRWTGGRRASLVVPLKSGDRYRLELWAAAFEPPGQPPQTVDIVVNGRSVGVLTVQGGVQRYEMAIPANAFRPNLNSLQFDYRYSMSPQEAGLSADPRSLAVLYDRLRLTRVTGQ